MGLKLLISDANILIDMITGGILDEMFELDYEFGVPDVLFYEELRDRNPDFPKKGLKVLELNERAIIDTVQISAKHAKAGVSNNDYLALALARQEDCPLVTGDRSLRQISLAEGIEVRGTIWLVGEMFEAGIVNLERVRQAYILMKEDGSRLPWDEVDNQLGRFARDPLK